MSRESEFEIIECVLGKDNSVVDQNEFCKNTCGDMVGKYCNKGCQNHLKNKKLCPKKINLLQSRKVHGKFFDITYYNTDNLTFIKLFPVEHPEFDFQECDLTEREQEIATLMFQGYKNTEIIKILNISKATLKTHINHIYQKIGAEFKELRP